MPDDLKRVIRRRRRSRRSESLGLPVIGMESEFNVLLDGREIDPRSFWGHPRGFITGALLPRERSSSHVVTGGAVYFDRGVIEVVTPVIELAPGCSARVVRNLWEQIGYVRQQLDAWSGPKGHDIRLRAYSAHYNISFEIPKHQLTRTRNVKTLAHLLAYLLPVPVMMVAANRRSTGVGVRPRGERIEITVDFTPDPTLMIAAASLIAGIVRGVMEWDSYDLSMLDNVAGGVIAGVVPGPHTTRKGWLTKDVHYDVSPYTSDPDAEIWRTLDGKVKSLRRIAFDVAMQFRHSIRRYSDPFTMRLLFSILEGRAPSLLDLPDRPAAYDDVGRLCRWGMLIDEIANWPASATASDDAHAALDGFVHARQLERRKMLRSANTAPARAEMKPEESSEAEALPLREESFERRRRVPAAAPVAQDRRARERRKRKKAIPFPDRRLTRSAYERVFLMLVSGKTIDVGGKRYRPIGMRGWTHAVFKSEHDGTTRLFSIDRLLGKMHDWS